VKNGLTPDNDRLNAKEKMPARKKPVKEKRREKI
jgi:hypothetical protein